MKRIDSCKRDTISRCGTLIPGRKKINKMIINRYLTWMTRSTSLSRSPVRRSDGKCGLSPASRNWIQNIFRLQLQESKCDRISQIFSLDYQLLGKLTCLWKKNRPCKPDRHTHQQTSVSRPSNRTFPSESCRTGPLLRRSQMHIHRSDCQDRNLWKWGRI